MTSTVNCWICYCSFVYGCVFVLRRAENKMLLWFLVQSFWEKKMSSTITSSHFELKKSRSHKRKHSDRMERERETESVKWKSWWLNGCNSEILEVAEVISLDHRKQGGKKKRQEMQTGMRGKRSPSRRVFVCYCDITSLEEQLQMVSTVTEQSDTSPLIHSDSWNPPDRCQREKLGKGNATDRAGPAATTS